MAARKRPAGWVPYAQWKAANGGARRGGTRRRAPWGKGQLAQVCIGFSEYLSKRTGYSGMGASKRAEWAAYADPAAPAPVRSKGAYLQRIGARIGWAMTELATLGIVDVMAICGMLLKLAMTGCRRGENPGGEVMAKRFEEALVCLGFEVGDAPGFLEPAGDDDEFDEQYGD